MKVKCLLVARRMSPIPVMPRCLSKEASTRKVCQTGRSRIRQVRPCKPHEVRDRIRKISLTNPGWGAPRIHGELLQLGIDIGETTVAKYMVHPRRPSSQTWKTFLKNHMQELVSADFFVVPTATFRPLFVFLVLSHDRRRILHWGVTAHPTAEWTAQQLRYAFPWDTAPRYLLRDRDCCYGEPFPQTTQDMGIQEILSAPRSPWQNALVERLIGSIRRECLDHVLIFNDCGLRRILKSYFRVLREVPHSLGPGQRCTDFSPGSTALARKSDCLTSGRRLAPSLRTSGRLKVLPSN